MCGIFCSISAASHVKPSEQALSRLSSRGPDKSAGLLLHSGTPPRNIALCSTVLSLRGSQVTAQPYQDEHSRYVLCWNGEAWTIDNTPEVEDDTAAIHSLLSQAVQGFPLDDDTTKDVTRANVIASALSRVAGPYAFVFLDVRRGHLYFGRDFLGRRSLCWSYTLDGSLLLASVPDASPELKWRELEADGVYFVDVKDIPAIRFSDDEELGTPSDCLAPYKFIGSDASVIPRLSLNKNFPLDASSLNESSHAVNHLFKLLQESLRMRILNVPDPPGIGDGAKIAILFSGGLDCTVLARMCHDLLPSSEPIDLLNVAFENPRIHAKLEGGSEAAYEACPDRVTGRSSLVELQSVCPDRVFRFVAVNVSYVETQQHREEVVSLMHPHNTEMDLSISYALYFAARGICTAVKRSIGKAEQYQTPARVLLSGLGADELFGGYTRHATAFRRAGFPGLIDELELDVARLGKRNLGRDDRIISHWGKEARFPFLDEALVAWALAAPVTNKCGFGEPRTTDDGHDIEAGKKVLRCVASKLGMTRVAREKKRAIQFGARTAKMETGKTKGTTLLS